MLGASRVVSEPVPHPEEEATFTPELSRIRVHSRLPRTADAHAPVALGVLATMARVAEVVTEVAATVCEVVDVAYPGDLASVYVDPAAHLLRVRAWVGSAQNVDELTVPWVLERIHPLADTIATHLGEVHDGQLIEALCPWCQGRTAHRPNGGERTLVVFARQSRTEQAAKPRPDGEAPARREPSRGPLIVCHGEACTPPDAAVGLWIGERPAWPEREWDWLSKQLLPVDGARPVEVPPAATA